MGAGSNCLQGFLITAKTRLCFLIQHNKDKSLYNNQLAFVA